MTRSVVSAAVDSEISDVLIAAMDPQRDLAGVVEIAAASFPLSWTRDMFVEACERAPGTRAFVARSANRLVAYCVGRWSSTSYLSTSWRLVRGGGSAGWARSCSPFSCTRRDRRARWPPHSKSGNRMSRLGASMSGPGSSGPPCGRATIPTQSRTPWCTGATGSRVTPPSAQTIRERKRLRLERPLPLWYRSGRERRISTARPTPHAKEVAWPLRHSN